MIQMMVMMMMMMMMGGLDTNAWYFRQHKAAEVC